MTRDKYIELACAKIKGKYIRNEVAQELSDHIDDRIEYYREAGYVDEIASQKALEHMGDAETVSNSISKLHNLDRYKTLADLFTYLYLAGGVFGAFCTLMLFSFKWDLYEWSGAFVCFASSVVFILYAFSFYFSHKSQNEYSILQNGIVSIVQTVLSCFTMIPCGYSVLSLLFEFPYAYINNNRLDYFYWPFEETIADFLPTNSAFYEVGYDGVMVALWILMCFFAVFPLITGIISIVTAGFIKNDELDRYDNAIQKKIKRFGIVLIALGFFGLASISFQYCMDTAKTTRQNQQYELEHGVEFIKMYEKFDKIKLPVTPEDIEKEFGYLDESYEEYGCYYTEDHADFYFDNMAVQNDTGTFNGYFDKKGISNNSPYEIANKDFEIISKIPMGTSLQEFYEEYFSVNYISNVSVSLNGDKTVTEITLKTKDMGNYAYLTFENDKLTNVNVDSDDYYDEDLEDLGE